MEAGRTVTGCSWAGEQPGVVSARTPAEGWGRSAAAADQRRAAGWGLPAVPKEVVPSVQAAARPKEEVPAVRAAAVLPKVEARSVVAPAPWVGERRSAVGVRRRESALRPVWVVFDRSSRNPALSH
jgi:hypothetical protein